MRYKLPAAAFFHAAALVCLAAGCAPAPQTARLAGATPTAAPTVAQDPAATPGALAEGVQSPLPAPTGYVNDYMRVLDDATKQRLEEKLARLKERAGIEMAVAVIETTGGQDISEYSLAVARGWGIGPPGEEGGGLLLLVAVKDRKWHIQVSRRLEADLPDDEVAEIGGRMKPHFVEAAYGRGLEACVDGLIERLAKKRNFQP